MPETYTYYSPERGRGHRSRSHDRQDYSRERGRGHRRRSHRDDIENDINREGFGLESQKNKRTSTKRKPGELESFLKHASTGAAIISGLPKFIEVASERL